MTRATLLAIAILAAGCGDMGLTPAIDTGGYPTGLPGTDNGDDKVTEPLAGRTYAVDLTEVTVTEPSGLNALLSQVKQGKVLFYVADQDATSFHMDVALAAADGSQSDCEPIHQLPTADWSANPAFDIQDDQFETTIGGKPATLYNLDFSAVFYADASGWSDGIWSSELDTRELEGSVVSADTDLCALVSEFGADCHACPSDGQPYCADLVLQMNGTEVKVDFDPNLDTSGC